MHPASRCTTRHEAWEGAQRFYDDVVTRDSAGNNATTARVEGDGPTALVLRAAGTNCDAEMCRAFMLAGARVRLEHIDEVSRQPGIIESADLIGFPGGFSYGDDIASGRVFAARLRARLWPALRDAARRGTPMIGVCNGFQVMVQLGLLPGPAAGEDWPEADAPEPTLALAANAGGRFVDRWVRVAAADNGRCVWTEPIARTDGLALPIAHAEGRFVTANEETLDALEAAGRVALRYVDNPNGSARDIAGVCDASGRIFGLMPHPERFLDWTRHPAWTRLEADQRRGDPPGLRMFRAAVESVRERVA